MSRRRFGIMASWFHQARAQHSRELGAPQPFPLTGDNVHTAEVIASDRCRDGGTLADARYRDWLIQRDADK